MIGDIIIILSCLSVIFAITFAYNFRYNFVR